MADGIVDLRSDTVTQPSPAMRRAMAEAEVGDDVFLEDPTLNRLQQRAADVFEREASLFVPSGSMGNLISILAQTRPGQEVICEEMGHIYNYEMASMCSIAGVLPRVITTPNGILSWPVIERAIRPSVYYRPRTALVSLENTHNMAGGTVYPTATVDEICERSHESGLLVHMDGARIFNAAEYLGERVAAMTRKCDSIQFCLSKGLGAPVGSMIVGSREFVERCRGFRKMLGGGMRQAGVLAAAGLVALEDGPKRLGEDHANARRLAAGLAKVPGIDLDLASVQTNIVIFELKQPGMPASDFLNRLAARGIRVILMDATHVRMVTHLHINKDDIDRAVAAVTEVMRSGEYMRSNE